MTASIPVRKIFSVLISKLILLTLAQVSVAGASEGGRHIVPKQAAILGTSATWAYLLLKGTSITNCERKGVNLRAEHGVDAELSINAVGGYTHKCLLREWSGLKLSYTPMVNITHWSGDPSSQFARTSYDVAFVPMIRFEPRLLWLPMRLDFEIGVGPALMEQTSIGNRVKSTHFQFSDHFGIGVSGMDRDWRLGFAFRHVSNLNLISPNNGVNFFGASFEIKAK